MAAFNLGQVLGDATQGFMAGEDRGQVRRGNEQKMAQSKVVAEDQHKQMAQAIKTGQQQQKINDTTIDSGKLALEIATKNQRKYESRLVQDAVVANTTSVARGKNPNFTNLNSQAAGSKSFSEVFGSQFGRANSMDPADVKMAVSLMTGGQGNVSEDPALEQKAIDHMNNGMIFSGNVKGERYLIDNQTMMVMTGAQDMMSTENAEMYERAQLGILGAYKTIDQAGEAGMSLYKNMKQYEDLITKMKEAGETVPKTIYDAYDETSDIYNKEMYGSGGAKDKALERTQRRDMDEAEVEDAKQFKIASEDKGLIKKYNQARDAFDSATTWAGTRDKVFDTFDKHGLDWDAWTNAKGELAGYWSDLNSGDDVTKQKAYARIKTLLGAGMADYIKEMSGAAVSNEERMFLNDLVFGGNWKSREELETRVSTFLETRVNKAKQLYTTYGSQVKPNQAKERLKILDSYMSGRSLKPLDKPEVDANAPKVETKSVGGYVSDKITQGVDAVKNVFSNNSQTPLPSSFEESDREPLMKHAGKYVTTNDGKRWLVGEDGIPVEAKAREK